MQNEETTNEGEVETQDTPVETAETPAENPQDTTNSQTLEERVAKAEADAAKYRRLFEKSQKPVQAVAKPAQTQTPSSSTVDVDERILKASGMPEDLLKELKDVAAIKGLSLIDAQTDKLFVAVKAQFEKDEKSKSAALGASRGSGQVQIKKGLNTPNLSKEDHMKLVKSRLN